MPVLLLVANDPNATRSFGFEQRRAHSKALENEFLAIKLKGKESLSKPALSLSPEKRKISTNICHFKALLTFLSNTAVWSTTVSLFPSKCLYYASAATALLKHHYIVRSCHYSRTMGRMESTQINPELQTLPTQQVLSADN